MEQKTILRLFYSLCMFLFIVSIGLGQSIFDNPITGNDINPEVSNPYTNGQYVDPNITVSGIGKGTGAVGSESGFGTNNRYNLRGWETEILDPNAYFEFTLVPNPGYKIDFISFEYTGQKSETGPTSFSFRSSIDLYVNNIESPNETGVRIDLSSFQNITSAITFRFYAWNASSGLGTFSINDFTFHGIVSHLPCASTVTWNGTWSALPDSTTEVIIASDYNTGLEGNFEACNITVHANSRLTVANGTFVEVINNVIVNGELLVETQGNFVQSSNYGTFTLNSDGDARVFKETPPKPEWYYYTYWSSPVKGQTIQKAFPNTGGNRRFWFNATNYLDEHTTGTTNGIPDNIDDDGNDWQYALGSSIMATGVGYAITEPRLHIPGESGKATFVGEFNTGNISVAIYNNPLNTIGSWNLIGNPYPSAIDFIAFQQANSNIIDGAAYFWSQATPPSADNPGNHALNFSQDDYAVFTIGSGGTAGGNQLKIPDRYISSCQSFFIAGKSSEDAIFTNAIRLADGTSNNQFFKNSESKTSIKKNKLWVNLTSDNGVFNQVLTAYVDGATNEDDGLSYDAPKLLGKNFTATLYSNMESSNKKFAIQGKAENSLDVNETIQLGFATNINVATLYTLSIAQLQGEFLINNTIYLRDNILNIVHDLSEGDYTFTSEVGEFNDRFVIMFNNQSLSTDNLLVNANMLKIIDLNKDQVQFTVSNNLMIKKVSIFDLLGRELYQFKGQNNSETYTVSNLKNNIYIVRVELSNGAIITKKAVKK